MSKRKHIRRGLDGLSLEHDQPQGKILSAFRKVDSDSSSLIGGALGSLESSNDIPQFKNIPLGHRAFVFDPRLLDKRFNRGFIAHAKFVELSKRVHESSLVDSRIGLRAEIGGVALLANNRRTLVVGLESSALDHERASFYEALAFAGIKGFTSTGKVSGTRKNKPVTVAIGTFRQPVAMDRESEIIEAVTTALELNLSEYDSYVELGELELKTYSSR